jgi:hypothetical protein
MNAPALTIRCRDLRLESQARTSIATGTTTYHIVNVTELNRILLP